MATPIRPVFEVEVAKTPYGKLSRLKSESEEMGTMQAVDMINTAWQCLSNVSYIFFFIDIKLYSGCLQGPGSGVKVDSSKFSFIVADNKKLQSDY